MLYTDYQTTFTTAFVEFNQRLKSAHVNLRHFEILQEEDILKDFLLDMFALRKIYNKLYEEDMHTDFLQPKVEIMYETIQNNIEDVRFVESPSFKKISMIIKTCFDYCQSYNKLISPKI